MEPYPGSSVSAQLPSAPVQGTEAPCRDIVRTKTFKPHTHSISSCSHCSEKVPLHSEGVGPCGAGPRMRGARRRSVATSSPDAISLHQTKTRRPERPTPIITAPHRHSRDIRPADRGWRGIQQRTRPGTRRWTTSSWRTSTAKKPFLIIRQFSKITSLSCRFWVLWAQCARSVGRAEKTRFRQHDCAARLPVGCRPAATRPGPPEWHGPCSSAQPCSHRAP